MNHKSILITGCSSGIGRCCALALMQQGWRVFAAARKQQDVEALIELGLEGVLMDLDDSASIDNAVNNVLTATHDRLDALFNNAGYGQPGAVEDLSRAALRANFETNVFGTHELTRRLIPIMRKQGHGRIVFNSSLLGFVALPYRGAYNASKFALEGLVDTLRLELAQSDISVALIEPGPVRSHFRKNAKAMFYKNIDKTNSFHKKNYTGLEERLVKEGDAAPFTLPPEAVLKKLIHALESPRPKARYYVTFPSYLFAALKRVTSTSMLDKVLLFISAKENK